MNQRERERKKYLQIHDRKVLKDAHIFNFIRVPDDGNFKGD